MTRESTLNEVCSLIALLPNSRVIETSWLGSQARIVVRVAGDSVNVLNHAAWTSNVQMEADTKYPDQHSIIASATPRGVLAHGELQILGIHLVWHLLEAGTLPRADGIRLLAAWKGAVP